MVFISPFSTLFLEVSGTAGIIEYYSRYDNNSCLVPEFPKAPSSSSYKLTNLFLLESEGFLIPILRSLVETVAYILLISLIKSISV
nr:MAG TPA: hypothetical protein [Caudoviricetes sp.]